MPVYVYTCPKCNEYEFSQRMSDDPLEACPTCGEKTHRIPQPVGITFVGKGFYSTENPKR